MRVVLPLLVALAAAGPALADGRESASDPAPYVRTCSTSQFGDLGRGWRAGAAVAGRVAFVGMRDGYRRVETEPSSQGRATPLKVLVVVDPHAAATVTIAPRSRAYAALGYNELRHSGTAVPLADGTQSVRFRACRLVASREPWNRGTQFGGYFLVSGRRCVHVDIATGGRLLRRKLSFGARCG